MITVNNFLLCFKLETGGQIIGWFGLVSSIVVWFSSACIMILVSLNNPAIRQTFEKFRNVDFNESLSQPGNDINESESSKHWRMCELICIL